MKRRLYALHDSDKGLASHGVFEIDLNKAHELNEMGYGIFWAVNEFKGKRQRVNLSRIVSWYCETDDKPKELIERKINESLIPSLIVESKRGYHIYWDAASDVSIDNYEAIQERIISFFGADKGVKDLCRILRAPGFYHKKNPHDPFLVREVFRSDFTYNERSMIYFFRINEKEEEKIKQRQVVRDALKKEGQSVWEYFIDLNCKEALTRISGSDAVNGENFSFKQNPTGLYQIYVNGKRTQCWLDENFKIGSHSKGGPGIFNWIKWYGFDNYQVVNILKRYFPEGFKNDK